ncbi:MAG: IS1380 family transposase, partial [Desulfobulbaceae bacterium]
TDDSVHGNQIGKFFHGYYKSYCFLPLYVFCESQPLLAWLRPSDIDGARGAWLALKWIVSHLREAGPEVKIIWRADSGFCRWRMLAWSEKNNIDYIVGIARNARLEGLAEHLTEKAAIQYEKTSQKARVFSWIQYGAKKWDHPRLVIVKAEHTSMGRNPRFIITTLKGDAQELYDETYCPRGDMENRIKEQQLGLFADRTSCHNWWPNQLRLLISTLAYVLVDSLRRETLPGTELESAQVTRIRLELLKIGAVVVRNTCRIKIHLSSSWPRRELFEHVHRRLIPRPSG